MKNISKRLISGLILAMMMFTTTGVQNVNAEFLNYFYPTSAKAKTLMYDKELHESMMGFVYKDKYHFYSKKNIIEQDEYQEGRTRWLLFQMLRKDMNIYDKKCDECQTALYKFREETYEGDYMRFFNNYFYVLLNQSVYIHQSYLNRTYKSKNPPFPKIKYYDQYVLKAHRYAKLVHNYIEKGGEKSKEKLGKIWSSKLLPLLIKKARAFDADKRGEAKYFENTKDLDIVILLLEIYRQIDPNESNNYYMTEEARKMVMTSTFYTELEDMESKRIRMWSVVNNNPDIGNSASIYIEKDWYNNKSFKLKNIETSILGSIVKNLMYIRGNGAYVSANNYNPDSYNREGKYFYSFTRWAPTGYRFTHEQEAERVVFLEYNAQDWPQVYKDQLKKAGWTIEKYNAYAKKYLEENVFAKED